MDKRNPMSEKTAVSIEKKKETDSGNCIAQRERSGPFQSAASPVEHILFLQRTIGNHVVGRLIRSGNIQTKLKIGQPGDEYEREADRVAEQVMRMPEPQNASTDNYQICRACPKSEENELKRQPIKEMDEEDKLQKKEIEEEDEEKLQAKGSSDFDSHGIESRIQSLKGGGYPLSDRERAFFEPLFGADFSQVKVHTDTNATGMARSVNARAFAMGNDIVFQAGQYNPDSSMGKKLMAHELTHVLQQNRANDLMQEAFIRKQNIGQGTNPAPRTPNEIINQARFGAWLRCHRAYERLAGILPPSPPGRPDPSEIWRLKARSLARKIFREDLNMEQVTDIVETMRNKLSPGLSVVLAPANDPECGSLRDAYVVGNRPPVHICTRFFNSTSDDQIATMIHESAHMAGIGEGSGNEYCFYVDCDTESSCGGFNFADSWTQFVLCLSR